VIWGPGIKPGTQLGKIDILQIAPTIAKILGVDPPTAEGKPLAAIAGGALSGSKAHGLQPVGFTCENSAVVVPLLKHGDITAKCPLTSRGTT